MKVVLDTDIGGDLDAGNALALAAYRGTAVVLPDGRRPSPPLEPGTGLRGLTGCWSRGLVRPPSPGGTWSVQTPGRRSSVCEPAVRPE